MKPLLIIASSTFGRLVRTLAEDVGYEVAGFIDDVHQGEGILGDRTALGTRFTPDTYVLAMAIGYSHLPARLELYRECVAKGFAFPALVHPRAYVSRHATIGDGCIVMAGANVDAFSTIKSISVLWPTSVVSHDCIVGANTFISPNATLCGFVSVGHSTFIGAGSVIVDGSRLPERSFVKSASRYVGREH